MSDKNSATTGSLENAEAIIERFGGIRPMASKMDVPVTTVQGWKKRNVIPENRRADVLQAARSNNIEISDLIGKTANQNTTAFSAAPSVSAAPAASASSSASSASSAPNPTYIQAPRPSAVPPQGNLNQEAIISKINAAEKSAVRKSLWATVSIVAIVGGALTALLLWPINKQVNQNTSDIATVRTDVAEVNEKLNAGGMGESFLGRMMPDDLEQKLGTLQEQAQNIQSKMGELSSQAETMANGVIGPNAGDLNQRLTVVEQQLSAMTGGRADVSGLFDKLRAMQGQEQLSTAVADLGALFTQTMSSGGNIDEALVQAQGEDDALGQSLQGISPDQLKAAALLMTLSQVRSSLNRQEPFADDLALMLTMMEGQMSPELVTTVEALAPKAEQGVISPTGLSNELKSLTGDIVVASLQGEDVSVREKAMARMNEVLEIQKGGELVSGTDTQATIARAQKLLDEGNVQAAVTELQKLEGGAATTAQPLIDNAQATLMAQRLQSLLSESVATKVQQTSPALAGTQGIDGLIQQIETLTPGPKVVSSSDGSVNILPQRSLNVPGVGAGQ